MKCPGCGFFNLPGSGQCARCGAAFDVALTPADVVPPSGGLLSRLDRFVAVRRYRRWRARCGVVAAVTAEEDWEQDTSLRQFDVAWLGQLWWGAMWVPILGPLLSQRASVGVLTSVALAVLCAMRWIWGPVMPVDLLGPSIVVLHLLVVFPVAVASLLVLRQSRVISSGRRMLLMGGCAATIVCSYATFFWLLHRVVGYAVAVDLPGDRLGGGLYFAQRLGRFRARPGDLVLVRAGGIQIGPAQYVTGTVPAVLLAANSDPRAPIGSEELGRLLERYGLSGVRGLPDQRSLQRLYGQLRPGAPYAVLLLFVRNDRTAGAAVLIGRYRLDARVVARTWPIRHWRWY